MHLHSTSAFHFLICAARIASASVASRKLHFALSHQTDDSSGDYYAMSRHMIAASTLLLAACGSSGASVPEQFMGAWGADCASPFVEFAAGTAKVFPDKATYTLKTATLLGSELSVAYDDATRGGTVTDVYVSEGATLRLDRTKAGAGEATWHKAPMKKCS